MTSELRKSIVAILIMLLAAGAARLMIPTKEVASFPDVKLEAVVPEKFGEWELDRSIVPLLPDPSLLAAINDIYSDTLARTYVNRQGQRVMLSLAYGRRQNDTMRVHRPEGCYMGQGFAVLSLGQSEVVLDGQTIKVNRLDTRLGPRIEPVSYWMVIGGKRVNTLSEMKREQLKFGLRGYIPDGLLFRISSVTSDRVEAYNVHDRFTRELAAAVPAHVREGLMGL